MDQKFDIVNILSQIIYFKRLRVMFGKLAVRFFGTKKDNHDNLAWLRKHEINYVDFIKSVDAALYEDVRTAAREISDVSDGILRGIPYKLGGGGCYPLIYFLIIKARPDVVVETGVAAGFSSYASLLALKKNAKGSLYSSDFPYFRIKNPEKYIGCVVPEELKVNWKLFIDGDKENIPNILKSIDKIDLLHYDSDKSYEGREGAMKLFEPYIDSRTIIIMDDIQDNPYFHDYINKNNIEDWAVLSFQGKYLGVIGMSNVE